MLTDVVLNPSDPILGIAFEVLVSSGGSPAVQRLERGLYLLGGMTNLSVLIRDPLEVPEHLPNDLYSFGATTSVEEWKRTYLEPLEKAKERFVVEFYKLDEGLRFNIFEVPPALTLRAAAEEAKQLVCDGRVDFELCEGCLKRAECTWIDPWLELFAVKGSRGVMQAKEALTLRPGLRVIHQRVRTD